MGIHLTAAQQAFYEAVDRILWEEWDPIGVNDESGARNEYSSYLPSVVSLSLSSLNPSPIFDYFEQITTGDMGLGSNPAHNQAIAKRVFDLRLSLGL